MKTLPRKTPFSWTLGFKSWEQLRNEAPGHRQILVKLGLGPIDNTLLQGVKAIEIRASIYGARD